MIILLIIYLYQLFLSVTEYDLCDVENGISACHLNQDHNQGAKFMDSDGNGLGHLDHTYQTVQGILRH